MNIKKIASIFTAVAIVTSLISSPANALGKPKVQQSISWGWEDGGDKGHRDFSEDDYDTISDMPSVKVTVLPATVGRRVILEIYNGTSWENLMPSVDLSRSVVHSSNFNVNSGLLTVDFDFTCWVK